MPQAHAIYGHSSSTNNNHNRNYRANRSKQHADGKSSLQSKRSGVMSNNMHVGGGKPTPHHSSVDNQQRMQQFKNNMREIQQNVKRTEEVLSIIQQNNSRNQSNQMRSPSQRREAGRTSDVNMSGSGNNENHLNLLQSNANAGLQNNSGISRQRLRGLQNSHSNKKLPTWKAQGHNSLIVASSNAPKPMDLSGAASPVYQRGGLADRSLDRIISAKRLGQDKDKISKGELLAPGGVMQSRAELLQNEYKKVIENHPGTIAVPSSSKYDDTDFLQQMFTKNPKKSGQIEPLGLNKQDSSEVLHKSQSLKIMIGDANQ